ncbi:MAG: hypothetical protein C0596_14245 [Marinilabiliales bacterium]|nr:MAG: hypothetical protein C0596_14245 [Marinilabiliales bacterium]
MKIRSLIISFVIVGLSVVQLFGQDGSNTPRTTGQLSKWDKMFPEVKYGDNIYNTGSNWFTFGYGPSLHLNKSTLNYNMQLCFYWRYRALYFNAGWHHASPEPKLFLARPMEQLNDIYGGAGIRFEDRWYNFAFFIGPSFAISWIPETDASSKINYQLGAVTEVQLTFKYLYDLCIGTSFYGSFNKRYQVAGVRLHFYFSNAFVTKY